MVGPLRRTPYGCLLRYSFCVRQLPPFSARTSTTQTTYLLVATPLDPLSKWGVSITEQLSALVYFSSFSRRPELGGPPVRFVFCRPQLCGPWCIRRFWPGTICMTVTSGT